VFERKVKKAGGENDEWPMSNDEGNPNDETHREPFLDPFGFHHRR
jgi:hypothetical protein